MSELLAGTSSLRVSLPRLVDDLGTPLVRRVSKKKRSSLSSRVDAGERQELSDERSTKKEQVLAEKIAAKVVKDAADKLIRHEKLTDVRKKLAQRLLGPLQIEQGAVGDDEKIPRKARVSCALSQEQINLYVADYKLNELDRKLVKGASDQILMEDEAGDQIQDLDRMKKNMIKNYRQQLNASCDAAFKDEVAKHIHLEIFKEITIERLVTAYMIAKREAVGAKDGDIVHVDWFALLTEFSKSLKDKFKEDNDACLAKIENIIDNSSRILNSDKTQLKAQYVNSLAFFRTSTLRKIQSIIAKTIAKISSIWEALNFSSVGGLEGLPSHKTFKNKSKGALFAFAASGCSVDFDDNGVGIDSFARHVIGSSSNVDRSKLIAYQLIPKKQYYSIPKNNHALEAFLNAAAVVHDAVLPAPQPVLLLMDQQADVSQAGGLDDAARLDVPSSAPLNDAGVDIVSPGSNTRDTSVFLNPDEVSFGSSNDGGEEDVEMTFSDDEVIRTSRVSKSVTVSVDFPNIDRAAGVQLTPPTSFIYKNSVNTASAMKSFLKELLTDVSGITPVSVLRLCSVSNSRETGMLEFIKFMDTHKDISLDLLYAEFVGSKYFQRLTCRWLIPFKKTDFSSIVPDGYCFYRALFQCLLRSYENYTSSLSTMQKQDQDLKMSNEAGGGREAFFSFFARLEKLLPECYGKSRVMNAHMTFFNLKCGLDKAFWGIIDAVAFVDFNCTAFVYLKDRSLDGYWAQYKCSSIFAMESRDLVVENMVGTAPSFEDVVQVVKEEPSYVILKNKHYFLTEHVSKNEMIAANVSCTRQILMVLQRKICAAASLLSQESDLTLSGIFDRLSSKSSTDEDRRFMEIAKETITGDADAEASDDLEETKSLLQSTELTAKKQSKDAKQKGVLAASCASQADFAGVIENLV
jgi:hypothetical protein